MTRDHPKKGHDPISRTTINRTT